ncbi:hypothetical protein C2S52_018267 [Perilla frutescens var. hirtella]|nr:hypothetical protein C2S52_018267 [Perilla frutescens var. hirtella]
MSGETMQIGESSAPSSSYYPYNLNYANDSNQNFNGYSNYGGGVGYFSESSVQAPPVGASTSKAPPPPPSPPRSSTWDFLNPFESAEKFYPAYSSSHDSREVREEEGIPDLEDDDDEVVKDVVHGDHKIVDNRRNSYSKAVALREEARVAYDVESKPNVYKNAVNAEEKSKDGGNVNEFKPRGGFKDDLEILKEIQVQFERASQSGNDLSKFLEVGKLPYKQKHGSSQVSSKILHLTAVSFQPSMSKTSDNADPAFLDIHQDVELKSKNLSSVLHKLHLWEKKLYEEVKAEEKMRVVHERKSQKIKRMDQKGSEAHKVDATRTLIRSLSTKIKIAIQVVDKISMKINRLRDEELWPQLYEFIQGLTKMWKSMLECHNNQCRAIGEAKRLDAITFQKELSDAHFEATRQLEHDLINWTLWFSHWVVALKGYVRAMNNWLMKCILYIPEETPDGIVPFSPGRMGAPTVFVVCNLWSQSLDRISEKEVVDSMRELASNVLQLWDRDKAEVRQRMLANKDEGKLKRLEKEEQKIQKEIESLEKRVVVVATDTQLSGRVVYQSETSKGGSLQASLQQVLEAMGKFTGNSLKIYEELLQRIEEHKQVS